MPIIIRLDVELAKKKMSLTFSHLGTVDAATCAIGVASLLVIVGLRRFFPRVPGPVVAVVLAGIVAGAFHLPVETIGSRFGGIPRSLPHPHSFYFSPEAMRAEYEEWTGKARSFLRDTGLVTLPQGETCTVEPSPPFQRPILAVASYNRPPAFSDSLAGHFFVPYPPDNTPPEEIQKRLEGNCSAGIPTTAVHEAYPGHHWHLVMAHFNPSKLRQVFSTPYFSEGWALYAERVMREQGFFTDPKHLLYQYEATIFRAARNIVDNSLHLGEMTFDAAVTFMVEKGNLTQPNARAEVGRYCSWPTQASAYLTGMLEIVDVRARWLAKRGQADVAALREFHDTLTSSGAMPTSLAERALEA